MTDTIKQYKYKKTKGILNFLCSIHLFGQRFTIRFIAKVYYKLDITTHEVGYFIWLYLMHLIKAIKAYLDSMLLL